MRRSWLAPAAVAAAALSVPMAGAAQAAPLTGQHMSIPRPIRRPSVITLNQRVATYVKRLEGTPYSWGGTSPSGFDCSGLTQYVYRHFGKHIERTAEAQFLQFRRISKARARRGDLVFFHDDSDPNSYVYHVGVYEGGENMVAATSSGGTVEWQSFAWGGDTVTFGTISH